MPTTLSSTFDLIYDGPQLVAAGLATVTMDVAAIGRGPFAVVGFNATAAVNGGILTLSKSGGGTIGISTVTVATNLMADGVIDNAQVVVPGVDSLVAVASAQNIDRFVIHCQAVGTTVPQVIS